MSIFNELQWRGLVQEASEGAEAHLAANKATLYIGFDPTAASLHVGSLLQIMALARMQRDGHSPIALVGGGTGMIGDPSGKSQERQLLSADQVAENCAGLRRQLEPFLDFEVKTNPARLVDNGEWINSMLLVDFLRDVGKYFTVNYMMAKDSVARRLEQEQGISYTEFSYLLLQSYDFLMLHDRYGCDLQMGGSDQWGNITAGIELVRRLRQRKAHGVVGPLVTTSSGVKFGKTEAGTIWLDDALTSPYRFYQFWLNTDDADVVRYLRYFTWLGEREIAEIAAQHDEAPEKRDAHRRLAREITAMVHGESALGRAVRSSEILFGAEIADVERQDLLDIFDDVPSSRITRDDLDGEGILLTEVLTRSGLTPSKGAAKRLIREGGAYLNNRRVGDERFMLTAGELLDGSLLVLRKGQKQYHLMTLAGGEGDD